MFYNNVVSIQPHYFVTGATGFLGTHLLERLLARSGQVHLLVRDIESEQTQKLLNRYKQHKSCITLYEGDLTQPNLGLTNGDLSALAALNVEFFHVAAIYDIEASMDIMHAINVEGTRVALNTAAAMNVKRFHYVSSVAVAGLYNGEFTEEMLDEAGLLNNAYLKTKHDAEKLVRKEERFPYRIYRPAMIVGHSVTGEINKVDGLYYIFNALKKLRDSVPEWLPLIGIGGGELNIVPVDFIADSMDYIAHKEGLDGKCFHLTNPNSCRMSDVVNLFAEVARAPKMSMQIESSNLNPLITMFAKSFAKSLAFQNFMTTLLKELKIPKEVLEFYNYATLFNRNNTDSALEGSNIYVKPLEEYARQIWSYWEQHLDEERLGSDNLREQVTNKVILITGASSGIGKATALKLAKSGAKILLVARNLEALEAVAAEIRDNGGEAYAYSIDLTSDKDTAYLRDQVINDHGSVDILINNAGRSIRRGIEHSYDRLHDFQRTMEVNYFGALRLILSFLPSMSEKGFGQVINISSIAVLAGNTRFSAYTASKAALDSFTRAAASEYADKGVKFTTINMPLVRTPMIAPTKFYDYVPTMSPEQAANLLVKAIIQKPIRIATRLGIFAQTMYDLLPNISRLLMNTGYSMFPDSTAAEGGNKEGTQPKPTPEQKFLINMLKGVNW
ncbi:MAG: SDR family oxidoreductase [Endozoicomonas sp. (ex Botrylloides leachii)]|nr:SDR family oxidoreductase [Endozoicomonas sp. (ex Botrylloides leachii)]